MWMDVTELRDFYADPLGQMARRYLRRRIRTMWPDARGLSVLGLGFATPYLRPYVDTAERVLGFMPAKQGVIQWPVAEPSRTALIDEAALPLPDNSIDRVLLVHGLENTETLRPMMREIWRVMTPEARVLVAAPNRRGIWTHLESTPFGFGHPFTHGQLTRLLQDCMFEPLRTDYALFMPPFRMRMMIRSAGAWEDAGERFWRRFGGIILTESRKRVTAIPTARRAPVFRPVKELAGSKWSQPVGQPAFNGHRTESR